MAFGWSGKKKTEEETPEASPLKGETEIETKTEEKTGPEKTVMDRLKSGLTKTRDILTTDVDDLLLGKAVYDVIYNDFKTEQ